MLRLVILDYYKKLLADPRAYRIFSDLLRFRQMNFERSTETHVYVDKLDLIGTHFLIYDTHDFFEPRIVGGIRTSYMDRCEYHRLKIPLEDMILGAKLPTQDAFRNFRNKNGSLVECNGWFINPEYSSKKTGASLPDILFFALTTYLIRQDIQHFIGATNERFKASRHVARVGRFEDGHILTNPSFPGEHKLTLVDQFDPQWQQDCYEKYSSLMQDRIEFYPGDLKVKSLAEVEHLIGAEKKSA